MKIPKSFDLVDIRCNATNSRGLTCGRYLGKISTNSKSVYIDFACSSCKHMTQIHIDELGIIHRGVSKNKERNNAPVDFAYIGT